MDDDDFTVDGARAAAARDELGDWVEAFLGSPGSDNAALGEQLGDQKQLWVGPIELAFDELHRLAGPPDQPTLERLDADDLDAVEDMGDSIDDGWNPPPLILSWNDGQLVVEDGNHRVEGLRRAGLSTYWSVLGFDDEHQHREFVESRPDAEESVEIPIRDVHLETGFETAPKYFAGGDVALSHLFAMLSATFPDGENYFVRSVAAVRDRIDDTELAREVEGFIGQESMHGREHRAFDDHLASLGYRTKMVERYTRRGYEIFERIRSERFHLAMTAADEHYTATLAELMLSNADARAVFTHDAVRRLFLWHSLEESEHKAVAFDTFRHVGGGEFLRRFAMTLAHIDFMSNVVIMTLVSVGLDAEARRHPWRTTCSLFGLLRSPLASASAAKHLAQYYRRGFHPDDRDTSELIARWRDELF